MEKRKEEMKQQQQREIWDCGSCLYDSFELKSLQHQLNSAISARTMSMPHLSHHHHRRQPPVTTAKKHYSGKISRSLHKLLRSVLLWPKHNHNTSSKDEGNFYVYDTSSALSTIPEVPETLPEFDGLSPEMKSLVTRTTSDRFISTSVGIGISCV